MLLNSLGLETFQTIVAYKSSLKKVKLFPIKYEAKSIVMNVQCETCEINLV